ncbi:astacin-like metalloendopeptidase isoform X2 [Engystomops pustulosus]|uniref:astacin-like metalloendopeptidase isoform X2 n=1 Tax=Engystomops pustulosus TaxID=76066 RepID=UPI003AFAAFAE
MRWILVICLLGFGGISQENILKINQNLLPKKNRGESFLNDGDLVLSETRKHSPQLFLWPKINKAVVIPYTLSNSYNQSQRGVLYEAFKDLETSTCVRFVKRTTQEDYISILPQEGCYSSVGRIGNMQVVSLSDQCVQRGKGVVLHEFMHVIGFWHEHSRVDRDDYVIIHWKSIIEAYLQNFCKYETTNVVVSYDTGSLLQYSSTAFAKANMISMEARNSKVHLGQRIKLSDSDILRINILYHCPQYVPSKDGKKDMVILNAPSSVITSCPEAKITKSSSRFPAAIIKALMAKKEVSSPSPHPIEESEIWPVDHSPSTTASTSSLSSQETKMVNSTEQPSEEIQEGQIFSGSGFIPEDSSTNTELNSLNTNATSFTTSKEGLLPEAALSTSTLIPKETIARADIIEESTILQTSGKSGEIQQQNPADETWSSSGSGRVLDEDHKSVRESLVLPRVKKRSLHGKTLGSKHHLRRIFDNQLILGRRSSSEITEPFCKFEHGFCGWKQSMDDDLDWRLHWESPNGNVDHFRPHGFYLSLKGNPGEAVPGQKGLLLRPILQPFNCISFWYGFRHSIMGTLNVYILPSGSEQTLLWSSGAQNHLKWTWAQIMLPKYLLYSNSNVIVEGVIGPSDTNEIALDDLYVGQCG